jgi:hypothetical protein
MSEKIRIEKPPQIKSKQIKKLESVHRHSRLQKNWETNAKKGSKNYNMKDKYTKNMK